MVFEYKYVFITVYYSQFFNGGSCYYPAISISALGKNSPPQFFNGKSCYYILLFQFLHLWNTPLPNSSMVIIVTICLPNTGRICTILFKILSTPSDETSSWTYNKPRRNQTFKEAATQKTSDSDLLSFSSLPIPIPPMRKHKKKFMTKPEIINTYCNLDILADNQE